jgi:hypothetical protein
VIAVVSYIIQKNHHLISNIVFRLRLFILTALIITGTSVYGQQKCGIVENTAKLIPKKVVKQHEDHFEQWIQRKLNESRLTPARKKSGPYRIPVVFHVIHNGEPVGTLTNISDEQIYSQLRVLNEDFQRRNADASNTPVEFEGVAGGMDIQFVIARSDPNGNVTTGINRVLGTRTSWTSFDEFELKGLSYWPAEDYLNIWVCDLTNFLGLAQYPESDLPGLDPWALPRETDGMMVQYQAFGSIDDGNFQLEAQYNKGRTVSHEIGHFLGLRHIWGDASGCEGTDYVDDTPVQDGSSAGCPKHPHKECTPSVNTMFMNFMDYTDDRCMNMFTKQQIERMEIVLQNSPRRKSLLTSPGLIAPGPLPNDLGLLNSRPLVQCTKVVTPSLAVKNFGTNTISSASIRFSVGGTVRETINFPLTLAPGDSTLISFTTLAAPDSISTFRYDVLLTNGTDDGNFLNDVQEVAVAINEAEDVIPMRQNFEESFTETWTIASVMNGMKWDTVATNYGTSLYYNAFNNFVVGDESWLVSPTLDFSNVMKSSMLFDVSYASRDGVEDSLNIFVSRDCGVTYERLDYTLPSVLDYSLGWKPEEVAHWANDEFVDLTAFAGEDDIRIAFVAKNASGNNLYLDNIEIFDRDASKIGIEPQYAIFGYDGSSGLNDQLKIGFNLNTRQNVRCEIINTLGKQITAVEWHDVLNQIIVLPLTDNMSAGAYVVRVVIDGKYSGKLIFKSN